MFLQQRDQLSAVLVARLLELKRASAASSGRPMSGQKRRQSFSLPTASASRASWCGTVW
jgi:hypothetical protein